MSSAPAKAKHETVSPPQRRDELLALLRDKYLYGAEHFAERMRLVPLGESDFKPQAVGFELSTTSGAPFLLAAVPSAGDSRGSTRATAQIRCRTPRA